jgi:hypothetical protein
VAVLAFVPDQFVLGIVGAHYHDFLMFRITQWK